MPELSVDRLLYEKRRNPHALKTVAKDTGDM